MSGIRRKLVIVGDGACGKTSLVILSTTGVVYWVYTGAVFDKYTADVEVDEKHVELAIWDTACPEGYDRLLPLIYPGTHVVLICFDVGNPDSLDNVQKKWIFEVNHFCPGIPFILVGCKNELRNNPITLEVLREVGRHPVTYDEGMEVCTKIQAKHYVECSGRTGEGLRDLFQIATREALRPHPKLPKKSFNPFKGLLKATPIGEETDTESQSAPLLDAAEEQELKKLLLAAASVAPRPLRKFRLLIIGKMGCGKTTILSKVCGGNMVDIPSTKRGVHNIEKEIQFEGNSKIIAHDSEGFEAGTEAEVDVVRKFINSRSQEKDINQRLHLVWYISKMAK